MVGGGAQFSVTFYKLLFMRYPTDSHLYSTGKKTELHRRASLNNARGSLPFQVPLHLLATSFSPSTTRPYRQYHSTTSLRHRESSRKESNLVTRSPPAPIPPPTTIPPTPQHLSHLTPTGAAHMISIAHKTPTHRTAVATATVVFSNPQTHAALVNATLRKGDALAVARIAGIAAAKKTAELIPLAHPGLGISGVDVDVEVFPPKPVEQEQKIEEDGQGGESNRHGAVRITSTVSCFGRTGVEMEALVAASVAGLALVDMLKGVDKGLYVGEVRVLEKRGGRGGEYRYMGEEEKKGKRQGGSGGIWEGGVKIEGVDEEDEDGGGSKSRKGWRQKRDKAGKVGEGHSGEYDWDWD